MFQNILPIYKIKVHYMERTDTNMLRQPFVKNKNKAEPLMQRSAFFARSGFSPFCYLFQNFLKLLYSFVIGVKGNNVVTKSRVLIYVVDSAQTVNLILNRGVLAKNVGH